MPKTVFYSWLSDLPGAVNRNFIEGAIEAALKQLQKPAAQIDARPTLNKGAQAVTETILKKIDACGVAVFDLSFIAKTEQGKLLPNPNVLIEYGYALKTLGNGRIIPVMNAAFGKPSETNLPFDLRHLRDPIIYDLSAANDEAQKTAARNGLVTALAGALGTAVQKGYFDETK